MKRKNTSNPIITSSTKIALNNNANGIEEKNYYGLKDTKYTKIGINHR